MQMVGTPRNRAGRRPVWISALITMVCLSVTGAYFYPTKHIMCVFCGRERLPRFPPPDPPRIFSDQEVAARVVVRDILKMPRGLSNSSKIAFMFMTPSPFPFESLWEKFFRLLKARPELMGVASLGHEHKYSIYVHASKRAILKTAWKSDIFDNRDIRSQKVDWGKISMVDAEKRLLANALQDEDNQRFVLLSESCIPLRSFDFVYKYLMGADVSFVDCFDDPGPHGRGRYLNPMLPEIRMNEWRKGAQWFTVTRQHALVIVADFVYYSKFKQFCRPGAENHNCYPDEHYVQTFLHMMDPAGIANWSVTHVDWSEGKWHPKKYTSNDVNIELVRKIQAIDESTHVSSDGTKQLTRVPCMWNGEQRPCYLFARKFLPETLDRLLEIFPNVTDT